MCMSVIQSECSIINCPSEGVEMIMMTRKTGMTISMKMIMMMNMRVHLDEDADQATILVETILVRLH